MHDVPQKIYLAGPMAGLENHNFPAFNRIAGKLRSQGFEVFNPAENDDGGTRRSRAFYMRLDIPALMKSEAVVLLRGWQQSRGANLEVWIATDLDLPIYNCVENNGTIDLQPTTGFSLNDLPLLQEENNQA